MTETAGERRRRQSGGDSHRWPPDAADVSAARDGDTSMLGEILSIGYPKLVAFYRGMGLPFAEAEDLASEACEGMVRNLPRLRQPAAFEAWFWTIARNRVRSRLRRRGRIERELEYAPVDQPDHLILEADEHRMIRTALAELSPRDRQILWLREVEGLTHDEIAGRFGVATGAIRVAALRARRRLEEVYTRLHPED